MKIYKIWLMGGIGNQLFQINYGLSLAKQNRKIVFVDNLIQKDFITTKILSFNIHPNFLDKILEIETQTEKNIMPIFFSKVNILNQWSNFIDDTGYSDPPPSNIFGYFQVPSLHKSLFLSEYIKSELFDTNTLVEVVIHLRFGDSPNRKDNEKLYRNALEYLKHKKKTICICTDDKNTSKKFMKLCGISDFYINKGGPFNDFSTLMTARVVVVAPSTYSWWSTKLSKKVEEVIISKNTLKMYGPPSDDARIVVL